MRVLYFSPRDCWPVTTGARLRDFHLARQLTVTSTLVYAGLTVSLERRERLGSLANSEVILVARGNGYVPLNLARGLIGPNPITVLNYVSPRMMTELEQLLRSQTFDAIQVEGVHLFSYVRRIRELAPRAFLLSDWHNIESEILARYAEIAPNAARRFYARRSATLLRRCERQLVSLADAHTVCSERERDILREWAPWARIEVIGNGVDAGYFAEAAESSEPRRSVVFVGSMDYHANIDAALYFARETWPRVREKRPDLEFVIVGSRPAPAVLALAKLPGITVTGTVEDIRPYYRRALAVVIPVRVGSGTRLKALEAMAAGVPVISTTLGAEGLTVKPGQHLLIADSPADMADRIATLEAGSPLWKKLSWNASRLVAAQYDWSVMGAKLRQFYAEQLGTAHHKQRTAP
jgi:sugar transferase (PEP-CTERM/EpsH1 system associated)